MEALFIALIGGGALASAIFGVIAFLFTGGLSGFFTRRARLQQIEQWDLKDSLLPPAAMSLTVLKWILLPIVAVCGFFAALFTAGLLLVPFLAFALVLIHLLVLVPLSCIGGCLGGYVGVRMANTQIANAR